MPVIRCSKCGQAYDVPGVIAVRLSNSIATCHCGEWIAGSKAAVLARMVNPDNIREIDLQPYRVKDDAPAPQRVAEAAATGGPRSVRIIARGSGAALDQIFTIREHPLWIGRQSSHVVLPDAGLSIRHCSISVRGDDLVVRDADSHMGTFLDGEQITEAAMTDGIHLLRVGSALLSVEPTTEQGQPVEPLALQVDETDESQLAERLRSRNLPAASGRTVLTCIQGPLHGQEFEIPPSGLVVGREGHVRVPDEFLSRRHFEVLADPEGTYRVRDLGSRNGTFLNTLPANNTRVRAGDEIRAGNNRFKIEQRP